jgi:anti-sigma factor RsiW
VNLFDPTPPSRHLGDALSGLLDGELPSAQEQAALAHLGGCPSCAEELLLIRQARTWVRALPPVDAPAGFFERVLVDGGLQPSSSGRQPSFGRQPFGRQSFGRQSFGRQPFGRQSSGRPAPPLATRSNLRRRAGLVAVGAAAAAVTVLGVATPRQQPVAPAVPRLVEAHATSASVGADVLGKLAPMGVPVSFGR